MTILTKLSTPIFYIYNCLANSADASDRRSEGDGRTLNVRPRRTLLAASAGLAPGDENAAKHATRWDALGGEQERGGAKASDPTIKCTVDTYDIKM